MIHLYVLCLVWLWCTSHWTSIHYCQGASWSLSLGSGFSFYNEDPLVSLSCFLLFDWVVVSLTHSPFPLSIPGADPAILKRGGSQPRVKGGSSYMLPFKCIDQPKKKGVPNPGNPLPPGSANEFYSNHLTITILFYRGLEFIIVYVCPVDFDYSRYWYLMLIIISKSIFPSKYSTSYYHSHQLSSNCIKLKH